ncbi:glycoside hydrolase family 3 N-terminal domain-containing protein [Streptomyces shenzhenensis]|uniref:glycoside hydrolase family 3 N-terminal domain-containing protein n=1 Tax=Streptomyces shenzhenensis TaxID=943815 RepID=UPI0033D56DC6
MRDTTHYQAARADARDRATALLARMTIEEKCAQLVGCIPGAFIDENGPDTGSMRERIPHGVGHVSNLGLFGHKPPVVLARTINEIQRFLVQETRLGIPAVFHNEALTGVVAPDFTLFPGSSALAAGFSPQLVEQMADIVRRQMREVGFVQALAPVMDVARDPRWGRFHETYGEDVHLVTAMSVAYTRGLQGDDPGSGVMATAKHFLGYSLTEAGQNMAAAHLGPRELYDVHATPFEAAIRLAGLAGVMNSYSEIDGVPVAASREVLTDLLRDRLGFRGSVISDYHAVAYLSERNRVADSYAQAGAFALRAGIDVELPVPLGFGAALAGQVRDGNVSTEDVDTAVIRVLTDKFAAGLFDDPYVPADPVRLAEVAAEGQDLSRELARRSVTLLKNDGDLLPLRVDDQELTIAVIGPHADSVSSGITNYTYPAMVLMLQDILNETEASISGVESVDELFPAGAKGQHARELAPIYAKDVDEFIRTAYDANSLTDALRERCPRATVLSVRGAGVTDDEPSDIEAAVNLAREADLVVLALGGRALASGAHITEGEGNDSADIDLPGNQRRLAAAVAATGTPTVATLSMGRPYGLAELFDHVPAVVTSFYAGPHANDAVADVLLGRANPAGRLPFTLPRSAGQIPVYYSQKTGSGYRRTSDDMHRGYLDLASTPLLPFGFGLSYTSFDYSLPQSPDQEVPLDGSVTIEVEVSNVGDRAGEEVVQLYVSDTAPLVTRPELQLVGFERVPLGPFHGARLTFVVPVAALGYTGADGVFGIDPGPVVFTVGSSSDNHHGSVTVTLTGERRPLSHDREYLSTVRVGDPFRIPDDR